MEVKEGDSVSAGQVLATVGAMKMEVQVKSLVDAVVEAVIVAPGAKVVEGALLIRLK